MGMGMVGLLPDHTIIPLLAVQDDHNLDSHHHHHHHHHRRLPAAVAPIHFWQQQQQQQQQQHQQQQQQASGEIQNYLKKPVADNPGPSPALDRIFNVSSAACAGIGIGTSSSSGSTTCQDCGNQAKKDCSHRRCRTCCKSRGFECSTHVKSTWVPAARRRERQLHSQTAAAGSSASNSTTKKPRLISSQTTTTTASHTSTSNTTPPRSFDSGSSHQDASFRESLPGQVRAPAVFKCVRVTAVEDGEDEYAYQAVVKIGGHVFKGFLYDQGVDSRSDQGIPNFSDLHLGGARNARNGAASTSPIVDPSDVYAASGPAGLLGGATGFGNPIN
ncbi:hypothetical protein H6P81_001910 [Aristolochia fimbriata]|uniref:Uncharacterized protein n=1 Tax=Aristolochia fimbriata TaxID=158543 RepID=A0AAV7F8A8_ARIFI|nr:hypothetical protein H6P81_001910 [Aristolochia fimbriata]